MKAHSQILTNSKPIVESIQEIRTISETYNSTNTKLFPKHYKFTSPFFIGGELFLFENIGDKVRAYIGMYPLTKSDRPFLYNKKNLFLVVMVKEIFADLKKYNPIIHSYSSNSKKSPFLVYSIDCAHSTIKTLDVNCSRFQQEIRYNLGKVDYAIGKLNKINSELSNDKTEYLLNARNNAFILPTYNLKKLIQLKEDGISLINAKSKKQYSHEGEIANAKP